MSAFENPNDHTQCPRCRALIPKVARICATCGAAVPRMKQPTERTERPSTKVCPSCASTVPATARICGSCNSYFPQTARTVLSPPPRAGNVTPVSRAPKGNAVGRLVFIAVLAFAGYRGYQWYMSEHSLAPPAFAQSALAQVAHDIVRDSGTFTGKIADLPQPAQDVLSFHPAESDVQTQSASIATRVEQACGTATQDYEGADDFPGAITVEPRPHGWTRVSWTLTCGGIAENIVGRRPTAIFEISHDSQHLRDVNDSAMWLTH